MDTAAVLEALGVYGGSFVVALLSGVLPLVNIELFLIGLVALAPDSYSLVPLVAVTTAGQMTAKVAMYWAGRGVLDLPLGKYRKSIDKWQHRFNHSEPRLSLFIFTSAATGLPPFFVISILAGTFKMPFWRFLLVGYLGRALRFALCAAFPALVMDLF
ncbi:VTT domain-containing protein [Haliangium sp.]|uniref:VTT domain-containing protein n=1 Tax=Haliangium sp. TaxID=2663208 RepID=UPI003D0CD777